MKTLVINTYAGSLLIGAEWAGADVQLVLEDSEFAKVTRIWNFPEIKNKSNVDRWPNKPLDDTVVIAHPPCAAFSVQGTNAKKKRGKDSDYFVQTERVMEYSLSKRCIALLIESVMPTMEGARDVHDKYAKQHGYRLYRILQNGVMFGTPQWRERFWAVFLRDDHTWPDPLPIGLTPNVKKFGDILVDKIADEDRIPIDERALEKQRMMLARDFNLSDSQVNRLLKENYGKLHSVLREQFSLTDMDILDVARKFCVYGSFDSNAMKIQNPAGFCGVLMLNSFWTVAGRALTRTEWKRVMGYPDEYSYPNHKELGHMKAYLSKGVIPGVAAWLLSWIFELIDGKYDLQGKGLTAEVRDGGIANFLRKKEEVATWLE